MGVSTAENKHSKKRVQDWFKGCFTEGTLRLKQPKGTRANDHISFLV